MFSVVIPVFNHEAYVEQAIWSAIRSSLVTEILIADDGSTDASASIVARLASVEPRRVRDLSGQDRGNRGAHNRLNQLVEAAKCDWVAPLNSDDVFVARRFDKIVNHPQFARSDFVFGNLLLMNERGTLTGAKRGPFDVSAPFPSGCDIRAAIDAGQYLDLLAHQNFLVTTSNMVFRRALHSRIGGFRPYRYVHDWDFALRAMALGTPLYVERYCTSYRVHTANTIAESAIAVHREAKRMLESFTADHPDVLHRPLFRTNLENNVNAEQLAILSARL